MKRPILGPRTAEGTRHKVHYIEFMANTMMYDNDDDDNDVAW